MLGGNWGPEVIWRGVGPSHHEESEDYQGCEEKYADVRRRPLE
jgi:hypothetical protein